MRTFLIIFRGVDAFGALVVRLLVYLSLVYPQPVLVLMLVLVPLLVRWLVLMLR